MPCSVSGRVCASSIAASCSGVQRSGSQAADALQRASGLIITVVTDLPQIEWGLKTESLTAVDQLAPAFVELRCLTALFFCQWPDDAVQRTAAAQFFKAASSVTSGSADERCRHISAPCGRPPASVARSAPARWPLPVQARRSPAAWILRRQNGP